MPQTQLSELQVQILSLCDREPLSATELYKELHDKSQNTIRSALTTLHAEKFLSATRVNLRVVVYLTTPAGREKLPAQ